MDGIVRAAAVRDDGDIVRSRQRADAPQLGEPAAPVNVGLPDGGGAVLEQLAEAVARVFVLAGDNARGFDLRIQDSSIQ